MTPVSVLVTFTAARWWAAGITVVVLGLALLLVGASSPQAKKPANERTSLVLRPFIGTDRRVSTSHTIALAWTGVVAYVLVALIIVNPADWSNALKNLNPTYLLLLAGPYASLVLAKATVSSRVANGSLLKSSSNQPATLSQLFSDDEGNTDVFDVQYVVFNVIAMVFVIVQFGRATTIHGFPDIPQGIILLTGGPAAVYLTNKFMPGAAPAIFSVTPSEVRVGQSVTIIGQNLSSPNATTAPQVRVGSKTADQVSGFTPTTVTAVVPDVGADLGRLVDVGVTGASGANVVLSGVLKVLGRVPTLDGAATGVARVGDKVLLQGDWSAEEAAKLTVLVDTGVVARTSDPGLSEITFTVPELGELTSPRSAFVKVKLGSEVSSPIKLLVSPGRDGANGDGGSPTAARRVTMGA